MIDEEGEELLDRKEAKEFIGLAAREQQEYGQPQQEFMDPLEEDSQIFDRSGENSMEICVAR
eukprot:10833401-Karenia_brevis.AAC.1